MRVKLKNALIEFKYGVLNGFPLCCVIHYSFDTLMHKENQRMKRHVSGLGHHGYVPCAFCFRAHKQTYQNAVVELFLETGFLEDKDFWLLPEHVKALVINSPSF